MKSTTDFFSSYQTRLVGVTENDADTPGRSCRFELMDRENAPNYIFSMFEPFCEDVKLKSGKKCLDPNLKNEITRSILKINKRFIAHFNR